MNPRPAALRPIRRGSLILAAAWCGALIGCDSGKANLIHATTSASTTTGGSTGSSGTTGGSTGIATSGTSTGGTATNATTNGTSTTGGATGGSTTGAGVTTGGSTGGVTTSAATSGTNGGTGGILDGGPPCEWVGDTCGVTSCVAQSRATVCVVVDGGAGRCFGGTCLLGIDLQNDPNNCGDYGIACSPDVPCLGGICQFSCIVCPSGTTCHGYGCTVDSCANAPDDARCGNGFCCEGVCIYADADNCGSCGLTCAGGAACLYAASTWYPEFFGYSCVSTSCTASDNGKTCERPDGDGGICCSDICVDPAVDPANCFTCSNVCPAGASCSGGYCYFNADSGCPNCPACSGSDCISATCGTDSDGIVCLLFGGGGSVGNCCAGQCIDLSDDPNNCGSCGNACNAGDTCSANYCGSWPTSCGANGDSCLLPDGDLGTCCAGACSDLSADDSNCGACGRACQLGSHCHRDLRLAPTGYLYPTTPSYFSGFDSYCGDGGITSCLQGGDCPAGFFCAIPEPGFDIFFTNTAACFTPLCDAGTSYCALTSDAGAVLGFCCDLDCVDISLDSSNCGGCGVTCATGQRCDWGACFEENLPTASCSDQNPCPAGSLCFTNCYPPTCELGSEGEYCSYGAGRWGACCGGACVDTGSDPHNCGLCGVSCSSGYCDQVCTVSPVPQGCLQSCGEGTICALGDCVGSLCVQDQRYCLAQDGEVGTCCPSGACAHLASDPENCGGCGVTCPPGTTCDAGSCNGMSACGAGHAGSYCDLDAGLSYLCCSGQGCIDTSADVHNCGACGTTCVTGESCRDGGCTTTL